MEKKTMNYKDVMAFGFPEHTARNIIKQAKKIAINEFEISIKSKKNLLQLEQSPFDNSRLGIAPTHIVEQLLGIPLSSYIESEKHHA
ncbi:DUF3173 family protein [Lactococcus garvieae]|uniref:DUF3173 family protein n=1 Tax=Lactococcus garvieae TaxID=1363 RepID=UPI003853E54A